MKYAILILAAGESARLGKPKQLLAFKGTVLLSHIIQACLASKVGPVHVVLGCKSEEIKTRIIEHDISILIHSNWNAGMGSSLAYGVSQLSQSDVDGIIVVLTDQIFLTKNNILNLIAKQQESNKNIITSQYAEGSGPPVLFMKKYFEKLTKLTGEEGAKSIIQKNVPDSDIVEFEKGHFDIDTPADLIHLT